MSSLFFFNFNRESKFEVFFYLHVVVIGVALVRHVLAFGVNRVAEKFNGPDVVASQKHATRLLQTLLDQSQRDGILRNVAARLLLSIVGVEIDVAARLAHSVA